VTEFKRVIEMSLRASELLINWNNKIFYMVCLKIKSKKIMWCYLKK